MLSVNLEHIDSPGRGAFGFGIECDPGPESPVKNQRESVFFDVIDDDTAGVEFGPRKKGIEDQFCALEFVLKMRGVDQDELLMLQGQIDLPFQNGDFVAAVFVESDFANAKDIGFLEEFRNQGNDIAGNGQIFGFFGVDAEPTVVREMKFFRPFWFMLGQLGKIIVKTLRGSPIKSGPECRFTNSAAAGQGHGLIIVGRPADHVTVGFNIAHGIGFRIEQEGGHRPPIWCWRGRAG